MENMKVLNIKDIKTAFDSTTGRLHAENVVKRIWERDYTVWQDDPHEISDRLSWLDCPGSMKENIPGISDFVEDIKSGDFSDILLIGMGGSSLAPDFFGSAMVREKSGFNFQVIDSTHPAVIREISASLDPLRTLFITSTKSGGTIETISLLKYFYNLARDRGKEDDIGRHFIAITDPGSGLEKIAAELNFRKVFLNDTGIGGRFSALSYFGLLPAALTGWDISLLLERAGQMSQRCRQPDNNPGATLGALLGCMAAIERNKLRLLSSPSIGMFGDWLEQLIAESTGKDGKGILPVICGDIEMADFKTGDEFFVYLKAKYDDSDESDFKELVKAGIPSIILELEDIYDIGGQMFLWEFAIAVAGHVMGIQPFDQPNVEAAKAAAKEMIEVHKSNGVLPEPQTRNIDGNLTIYGDARGDSAQSLLDDFLEKAKSRPGAYISIQAYLNPINEVKRLLSELKKTLTGKTGLPVTTGYGPRYLHSTGQLHKGDSGDGFFIQLMENYQPDLPIPDGFRSPKREITFGTLIRAQCLGDREALIRGNRAVMTIGFKSGTIDGLAKLIETVAKI